MYRIMRGRRVVGFATSGRSLGGAWAHIFLDCITCDQSIGLRFDSNEKSDRFSDNKARIIFQKKGWTVGPALCPACQ